MGKTDEDCLIYVKAGPMLNGRRSGAEAQISGSDIVRSPNRRCPEPAYERAARWLSTARCARERQTGGQKFPAPTAEWPAIQARRTHRERRCNVVISSGNVDAILAGFRLVSCGAPTHVSVSRALRLMVNVNSG